MEKGQRRKRRKFSDEYRAETVRLIRNSGKSIGQLARELGIGETALRRWINQDEVEPGAGSRRGAHKERAGGIGGVAPRLRRRLRGVADAAGA